MTDIDDIIEYIKSLKKGFDKDLFQCKINDLAYAADNGGLDYESFHTLFKIWLNLSIPITKWVSLGICLVPRERIIERTVEYSLRWLMASLDNQANFPRIGFVLDWLTAAMDMDCIDMNSLDCGYEIFFSMLSYETLTAHCLKLVYTLTKPVDVTRRRALELINYAERREGKKNMYRQLQVLLGLFKSYKPECVPNDVPSISIHTCFKKLNPALVERLRNSQSHKHSPGTGQQRLFWSNPINSVGGRNKKADPLVPNMEFLNIGSKQYADDIQKKTYLDFPDPVSLLQGAVQQPLRRPARLRSLLCNAAGAALLALAADAEHAFLSHDLHHVLSACFLDTSGHSYVEKQDLLQRLVALQRTLLQGLPVVTRFLAQYLPFWNERDFFPEILALIEWVDVDNSEHVSSVLDCLVKVYLRSQPLEQCAIMTAVTNMYTNLVYGSTRRQHYFMSMKPSTTDYMQTLALVAAKLSDMTDKGLQASPDDMRLVHVAMWCEERCAGADVRRAGAGGAGVAARTRPLLPAALALLAPSAALLDAVARLLLTYKQILKMLKRTHNDDPKCKELRVVLRGIAGDLINCLSEGCLSSRQNGLVFRELHPQLVGKLEHVVPEADATLSIRNHLALAPYTYMQLQAVHQADASNRLLFEAAIQTEFAGLSEFVRQSNVL